jgi:hypothetical protein
MKTLRSGIEKMNPIAYLFLKYWLRFICICQCLIFTKVLTNFKKLDFLIVQALRLELFYILITLCLAIISAGLIDLIISKKIV